MSKSFQTLLAKVRGSRTERCDIIIACVTEDIGVVVIVEAVEQSRYHRRIGGKGMTALAEILESNDGIQTLTMNNMDDEIAAATVKPRGPLPSVQEMMEVLKKKEIARHTIDFYSNRAGVEGVKAVVEILKLNKTVRMLDLRHNFIAWKGAKAIADVLKQNSTIRTINLCRNNIGDEGAKAVADGLKKTCVMRKIDLSYNCIGDEGVKAIAEALNGNNTVESVNLRSNKFGDEGAKALAEMISENRTVKMIDLHVNMVGDEGTRALTDALKLNNAICKLGLNLYRIDRRRVLDFAEMLRKNSTLYSLKCTGNEFDIDSFYHDVISEFLERNKRLKWSLADRRLQSIFIGLQKAFGNDVYTILLITDCLPHYELLSRARKVALLQCTIY